MKKKLILLAAMACILLIGCASDGTGDRAEEQNEKKQEIQIYAGNSDSPIRALDDPDDRPEMDMCLWYWIDTEKEITYGPYESAQALEEAADAQGVYVPAPESWTETYPAPSGARYD